MGTVVMSDKQPLPGTLPHGSHADMSTVFMSRPTTLPRSSGSTVANPVRATLPKPNPSTVVELTRDLDKYPVDTPPSPTPADLQRLKHRLENTLGHIDDDALRKLFRECRLRAPDCTADEIAYFVDFKLRWVKTVQNPIGLILTAVPRHFESHGHASVRELLAKQAAQRAQEWRETWQFWKRILDDPAQPGEQRAEARAILRELLASPDRPPDSEPLS